MKLFDLRKLAVLFFISLLATSCQDEMEQNLQNTPPPEEKSSTHLLLEALLYNTSTSKSSPLTNARIADGTVLSYDLAIDVFTYDIFTGPGRLLREVDGSLELSPSDEIPNLNVIVVDQEFQLFSGRFTFINNRGDVRQRDAGAIVLEDGTSEILIRNVPGAGDVFTASFVLQGDFSITGVITTNNRGNVRSVNLEGTFNAPEEAIAPTEVSIATTTATVAPLAYNVSVSFAAYNTSTGTIGEVFEEFKGTVDLEPVDALPDLDLNIPQDAQLYNGSYTYTTSTGERNSIQAVAFFTGSIASSELFLLNVPGVSNSNGIPSQSFAPEEDFFVSNLARLDDNNNLIAVSLFADPIVSDL